jgi:hypothetical protein
VQLVDAAVERGEALAREPVGDPRREVVGSAESSTTRLLVSMNLTWLPSTTAAVLASFDSSGNAGSWVFVFATGFSPTFGGCSGFGEGSAAGQPQATSTTKSMRVARAR